MVNGKWKNGSFPLQGYCCRKHLAQFDKASVKHVYLCQVFTSVFLTDMQEAVTVLQKHLHRPVLRVHNPVFPHSGALVQVKFHKPVMPQGGKNASPLMILICSFLSYIRQSANVYRGNAIIIPLCVLCAVFITLLSVLYHESYFNSTTSKRCRIRQSLHFIMKKFI